MILKETIRQLAEHLNIIRAGTGEQWSVQPAFGLIEMSRPGLLIPVTTNLGTMVGSRPFGADMVPTAVAVAFAREGLAECLEAYDQARRATLAIQSCIEFAGQHAPAGKIWLTCEPAGDRLRVFMYSDEQETEQLVGQWLVQLVAVPVPPA